MHNYPGPNSAKPNVPEDVRCTHSGNEIQIHSHAESVRCFVFGRDNAESGAGRVMTGRMWGR